MSEQREPRRRKLRFWPLVGLFLAGDLVLTLLYALVRPGFSTETWSNALCISAILLGAGSGIPFLFDAGRGLTLATKMGGSDEERREVLQEERRRREAGMTVTFALALTAFLIGVFSLVASLW